MTRSQHILKRSSNEHEAKRTKRRDELPRQRAVATKTPSPPPQHLPPTKLRASEREAIEEADRARESAEEEERATQRAIEEEEMLRKTVLKKLESDGLLFLGLGGSLPRSSRTFRLG